MIEYTQWVHCFRNFSRMADHQRPIALIHSLHLINTNEFIYGFWGKKQKKKTNKTQKRQKLPLIFKATYCNIVCMICFLIESECICFRAFLNLDDTEKSEKMTHKISLNCVYCWQNEYTCYTSSFPIHSGLMHLHLHSHKSCSKAM